MLVMNMPLHPHDIHFSLYLQTFDVIVYLFHVSHPPSPVLLCPGKVVQGQMRTCLLVLLGAVS